MNINGTDYYYVKNLQGDIISIINASGTAVVNYLYDSWGKVISTTGSLASTVGAKNPYRYRGYRYDTETGLYYLQSRYYNPEWGRFVSADDPRILQATKGQILGANLFTYCGNNSINLSDPTGYKAIDITSKLMNLMRKNALNFLAYIAIQVFFKGVINGLVAAFKYFYNNSKNGGVWDLKSSREWKLAKGDWFVFRGKTLRYDDPGNIHFGYVGSVMFALSILRAGAGVYQIYCRRSHWWDGWTYFDDPRDSQMIGYGHNLFVGDVIKKIAYNILKNLLN